MNRIAGLALLCACLSAQAATVTVTGDDVQFTYDDTSVFGTASVVDNSIFFLPTDFKAESLNGDGVATANATLRIRIEVITDGFALRELRLLEQGDYLHNGAGASVQQNGQLAVTSLTQICGGLFPCRSTALFGAGPLTVQGALTEWSAAATVDLGDDPAWGADTLVDIQLENLLTATTLNPAVGEQAFIEKKFAAVGVLLEPVAIPVPAAFWLFGSALALLRLRRRSTS